MRYGFVLFCAVFLLLTLPACGGGGADDAVRPLQEFFHAAAESEGEQAASFVCAEYRDLVRNAIKDFTAFTSYGSQLDIKVEYVDL